MPCLGSRLRATKLDANDRLQRVMVLYGLFPSLAVLGDDLVDMVGHVAVKVTALSLSLFIPSKLEADYVLVFS